MTDLERMKQLADAATPGPWRVCGGATPHYKSIHSGEGYVVFGMADVHHDREGSGSTINAPGMDRQAANAAYIAAANPSEILSLIARLEAAEAEVARLTGDLAAADDAHAENWADDPEMGDR